MDRAFRLVRVPLRRLRSAACSIDSHGAVMIVATKPVVPIAAYATRRNLHRILLIAVEEHLAGAVGVHLDHAGCDGCKRRKRKSVGPSPPRMSAMSAVLDREPPVLQIAVPEREPRRTENIGTSQVQPPACGTPVARRPRTSVYGGRRTYARDYRSSASSRWRSISSCVSPSTFSRSNGSVFDGRTFIHQFGYSIVTPSR